VEGLATQSLIPEISKYGLVINFDADIEDGFVFAAAKVK
jgi:hypothetical protein